MMIETFYRLFGVFDSGGTQADGQMLSKEEIPEKVEQWLRKNPDLRCINIIKVTKQYDDGVTNIVSRVKERLKELKNEPR